MTENLDNKNWIIPWGSIEYHGPHLPLLTDSIIANHISIEISKKMDAKVLEPLNIAVCFHMGAFPGTNSFSEKEVLHTFKNIILKAKKKNVEKLFLIIGHGENVNSIHDILDLCIQNHNLEISPFYIYDEKILERIRKYTDSKSILNIVHGGEIETSLMLEIQDDLVHLDDNMVGIYPDITEDYLTEKYDVIPLGTFSPQGYFGDPTLASKIKGRTFLKIITECFFEYYPKFHLFNKFDNKYKKREK